MIMRKLVVFTLLAFLLVFGASPAFADGVPTLPHAFYGSVTINGNSAPDGTQVSAMVDDGTIVSTQNPVATVGGSYGINSLYLLVQGEIPPGADITFYVNGVEAKGVSATFETGGGPTERNLSVTIYRPPAGGGGGGFAIDTIPPTMSNLSASNIGETSADISWTTDEWSTSQVEYWSSPGTLSPLDETMCLDHLVHLTGLTLGTTYYYKTMSVDMAENLAVSDVDSFTTLGEAPVAAFTSSDLSISPSEVDIGEAVNIGFLVTNTGTASGSYKIVLKVNGIVGATGEVTLDVGISKVVTFATARDAAGIYSVEVNGLSGSFAVREPPPPPPPPPTLPSPTPWGLIAGIVVGVALVAWGMVFWIRRKRAS